MAVYLFSKSEESIFNSISRAIDSLRLNVTLPEMSDGEDILAIYNKAISICRVGFIYKPGSIIISTSLSGTTIHMKMCEQAKKTISFCSQVEFEIEEIVSMARKVQSDYDRIMIVYRFFVENYSYAYSNTNDEKYHTTASPFLFREAVCEGFSLAFAHIINRLGIPCGIIMGSSSLNGSTVPHSWNLLELEGNYYHLDVTWDICTKGKGVDFFDYFLLSDDIIRRDHYWNDVTIPKCDDSTKDFYARLHSICKDRTDLITLLTEHIRQKKKIFGFRYIGNHVDCIISKDFLMSIFNNAMTQLNCSYSEMSYGFNPHGGTAFFRVEY